jgi:glycosyltransferase involved in cell wall biosynthesis
MVSIVVPVYNESQTIEQVLDRLETVNIGDVDREVIVVDDGSADGTASIVSQRFSGGTNNRIAYVSLINLGKGAAVRFGFRQSTGDIILIQDADLELDSGEIIRIVAPLLSGEADVVYGSRFLQPSARFSRRTRLSNWFLTALTNVLFGARLTDMETACKAFRRPVLQRVSLRAVGFDIEPELTARVLRAGYRIKEVPISYWPRQADEGKKISWPDGIDALYMLFRCRFIGQRGPSAVRGR